MFIGREQELKELQRLYQKSGFQLFVLYGRRRVGKTTFLNEFCKHNNSIFYSAEQTNNTMNLSKFSAVVQEHYQETTLPAFDSWENSFLYIANHQNSERLVLVIDEFPYLASFNPGLMSILQHLIDHTLQNTQLFLVLCGSYMGFMEKEVLSAKSPLFGRRTGQLHLKPFNYLTSSAFVTGFSYEERLLFYSTYGGTPLYLQQIDSHLSFEENIKNLFLKPTGYLYEEPMLLMRQEVQEPGIYFAISEAIAKGAVRSNEISKKTGEEASKCIKYITTLRALGILYKELPFGEKETSRRAQYHICDPMFAFWYRYVAPNRTLLETDASDIVWKKRILPDLNDYMGHMYERICREYLLLKNKAGELPILFTEIGRWWGTDPRQKKEVEIDLVARDQQDYLFAECKWRNEKTDFSVLLSLQEKADIFSKNRNQTWFYLFSKSGFTEALLEESKNNPHFILISLEDLFINL